MRRILDILWIFMKTGIKGQFQYRAAFWLDTLFFVFGYGTQAALAVLLVSQFDSINGWGAFEVMLLYAYVLSAYTLCNAFFGGVMWELADNIRSGEFDSMLTKPVNPLAYQMVCTFSPYYFLHFFISLAMIAVCVAGLGIAVTLPKLLVLALSIAGGAILQAGVLLLFASASFALIDNPLTGRLFTQIRPLIEYPISVFPKAIQLLLTTIVPIAFISFYPAQHLLGKSDFLMFGPALQYLTLPVGLLVFFLAYRVWRFALTKYKSTGS